jgi:hypothetical protein
MLAEPVDAGKVSPFRFSHFFGNKYKSPSFGGAFSAVGFGSLLFNKAFYGKPVLSRDPEIIHSRLQVRYIDYVIELYGLGAF